MKNTKTKKHNEKSYYLLPKRGRKYWMPLAAASVALSILGGQWLYMEAKEKIVNIIHPAPLQAIASEPSMIDWIMAEIDKAGISKTEALMIMQCESKQNPAVYNINLHADGNTSLDAGIWQINLYYHKISLSDALDYKKSTLEAIKIYKAAGNSWRPWTCGKILNLN